MIPFPYPKGSTPGDVVNSFSQDSGSMDVRITDEGGGNFIALTVEGSVSIDPEELTAVAKWCAEACAEMDDACGRSPNDQDHRADQETRHGK